MPHNADHSHANTQDLPGLTILRGLAAVWVVIHNDALFRDLLNWDAHSQWVAKGYLAVDFFLVLSGFILTVLYHHEFGRFSFERYRKFLAKRLARIYPLFLFLLGLRCGLEAARILVGRTDVFMEELPLTRSSETSS